MDMTEQQFINYVNKFGSFQKRSMFGGTGLFKQDAMFALMSADKVFIRGGDYLDDKLTDLGCIKYRHVKKQTTATVNYYDITHLFNNKSELLDEIVENSIKFSVSQRHYKKSSASRRLRDLPNMQLTLERMVKKAGVVDVDTFLELGAPEVFSKVKATYGNDVDVKLLWKFAGAIDGVHWKLIQEPRKRQLLASCA
ncbi:TfoX/Sxy family DNA transformation protein [Vibrio coralliilyticus]|uniref:TfoX/Sxy family DNA transformation protein n=1 Tax=Vibrio coralliilyticus TaxID=190893 RepID=UPI0006CD7D3A|nr:TfoX/Sxy family DNA transformation protein [Vibrio coralliilyticus]AXN30063.1 DNA transformation protein [Vibrio coralliilyticus]KPH25442.1 DNA transformation protein [Vibrio coralliilyticus]